MGALRMDVRSEVSVFVGGGREIIQEKSLVKRRTNRDRIW